MTLSIFQAVGKMRCFGDSYRYQTHDSYRPIPSSYVSNISGSHLSRCLDYRGSLQAQSHTPRLYFYTGPAA